MHRTSHSIAGMFMPIFERKLSDPGFVELTEPFGNHTVVLLLGRTGQWQIKTEATREVERDAAVFGRVRGGEKAGVLPVL